jgi:hypothetical protein
LPTRRPTSPSLRKACPLLLPFGAELTLLLVRSGNYDKLQPFATSAVIDAIKSERTRKLRGLRLSWKLHKVIAREVVCARQQEIKKANEHVAQMAVRFITEQVSSLRRLQKVSSLLTRFPWQSLEIHDANGRKVGTGSHDSPEKVIEVSSAIRRLLELLADSSSTVLHLPARHVAARG